MADYVVWCPDNGEGPDDGRTFKGEIDHEDAAIAWAQRSDWSSADYRIAGGKIAPIVHVQSDAGEVKRFRVSGEAVPYYSATALGAGEEG